MAGDIDRAGVAKAYGRWAPIYDLVFGKVFDHGRQSTIAEAERIGGHPRCRRRHGIVAPGLFKDHAVMRCRYFRADAAQGAAARARAWFDQCRDARGMMRKPRVPRRTFRRGRGAVLHRGARSRPHAGSFHPHAEARRRTDPGQSYRCRNRPTPPFELAFAPLARRLGWRPDFHGRGWSIGPPNMAASA